ncbi:hypothetical protein AVEN_119383-1, partial [Araneus ventricosus]
MRVTTDLWPVEVRFNLQQTHIHGGSSVESGFEPGIVLFRSRDLTTE